MTILLALAAATCPAALLSVAPQRPPATLAQGSQALAGVAATPTAPVRQPAARGNQPRPVQFDRPRADALWACGRDWKGSFAADGVTFIPFFGSEAPRNFPLHIDLARVRVGGDDLPLRAGTVSREGSVVTIDRGTVVETLATAPTQVEQSFVLRSLPNRGAVVFDLAMRSELAPTGGGLAGLTFANEFGAVRYHKAVAVDARGATLPLPIEWEGDSARITIPAHFVAAAQLPLVLDPLLQTNAGIAPGETQLQRLPDCAALQAPELSCYVWQRQWSATDQDCYGDLLDGNLDYVLQFAIPLDLTGEDWREPRVASNQNSRTFLVVAQSTLGGNTFIVSRRIDQAGATLSVVDVERSGSVGLSGNNYAPDVGGDPFAGTLAYYCVAWAHETSASNRDIHCKLVDQNGQLLTNLPIVLSNASEDEGLPSISETNRTSEWRLAWQRRQLFPPFDWNIYGGQVGWDGTITRPPYVMAGWTGDQTRPSCSSPIVASDGSEVHMVAFEWDRGGENDIHCLFTDATGLNIGQFGLSSVEAGGAFRARNQILPECESDGAGFVIGYSEFSGTDFDTYVSTVRWGPLLGGRLDEGRQPLGATPGVDDYWTRMAAYHSGANRPDPRILIAGGDIANNDTRVFEYGGYQPGQQFTVFASQCGTLPITAIGTAAIGATVRFELGTLAPAGTVFGTPGLIPLGAFGCNCFLGVANGVVAGAPLQFTIPNNPTLVGNTWSVQGFAVSGQNCLGLFDLSDTVDMTVR